VLTRPRRGLGHWSLTPWHELAMVSQTESKRNYNPAFAPPPGIKAPPKAVVFAARTGDLMFFPQFRA